MTIASLAEQCVTAMNYATVHDWKMEDARITVTTPKGWKAPPRFPRGELYQAKEDGRRIWSFPAMRVLAWMVANGMVKVKE